VPTPLRVLILEDSPADAEMLAHELRCAGFDLDSRYAESEAEYLAQLAAPLDLILIDPKLPMFDARDALRLLRERELDIPLFVIAEATGEAAALACMKLGAADYLLTDRLARLGMAVERALEQRQLRADKRAEQTLQQQTTLIHLLQVVAVAANESNSVEQALQTAVNQICTHIGWPVGHVYLSWDDGPYALASTSIWHLADPDRFATFRTLTEAIDYAPLADLPGQVLISGKPEWVADMTVDLTAPRAKLIQDIGVRAGFAFPVLVGAEVAAVLEFFSAEAIAPNAALLDVMAHIGRQLGRVVERIRAASALRESEERYRLIAENTGDVIMLTDEAGRYVYISPACRSLLGYDPPALIGTPAIDLIHPNDLPAVTEQRGQAMQHGVGQAMLRYRHIDGSWRWFESHGTIITRRGAQYTLGINRDVTERWRAEEALRDAEVQYRALVEQIPAIIYTAEIDERSRTRYVSPHIEAILGFSPAEWMADADLWLKQLHPEDRERVLGDVGRAQLSDEPVPGQYRMLARDGRVIWFHDAARVVRDEEGRPLFLQGISLDITERKQAEQALTRSEERYRTLFETMAQGVIYQDADGKITSANAAAQRIFGLTLEQMQGSQALYPIWKASGEDGSDVLGELYPAMLALKTGVEVKNVVMGIFNPTDQQHRWISMNAVPQFRPGEIRPYQVYATFDDITERKRVEAALAEERTLLAQRVEERTAALSAANAELARAARLKDEFLANMSHELRTPLNAVLGLSEALQEQVYGPLNEQQQYALSSVEESGRHLLELINDILDLAKIDAGKMDLDLGPLSVAAICQASLRLIKQDAHKKYLSVDLAIDPAVTLLRADARRLKQILVNLLSNAVKFTPAHGAIGLRVIGDVAQQVIRLTVWDTGIGIAKEELAQLFRPFVQLDSRLARQYNGTGLGLALVYRMAEMHGGSVAVASEPGAGSQFTVALPWHVVADAGVDDRLAPGVATSDPGTTREALTHEDLAPARARPAILLAEDNEANIVTMSDYLCARGYQMVIARNGAEAVARASEIKPAVILMDIQMPGMDGLEATRRIRAQSELAHTPIIALTALAMPGDRERCETAGADDYLSKPVSLRGLVAAIETQLRRQLAEQGNTP
jgi:PAS domain S-box-containing protein